MSLEKDTAEKYIIFATKQGYVKRMELNEIQRIRSNGLIAIYLEEGDELISVALTSGEDDVILVTKEGKAIRFSEEELRPMGRTARGVRGIKFRPQDELVDMACVRGSGDIFCIAEPVSYTHLDVYKRQLLSKRMSICFERTHPKIICRRKSSGFYLYCPYENIRII